jgi:CheY-like chemotaxis protein
VGPEGIVVDNTTDGWNVLVVDDEQDIHQVTKLALKRKTWRNRPMNLTSAFSRKEAEAILKGKAADFFHAALVDVVMETDEAGLELCQFIRSHCPRTLRIIVRTGQPGVAPPDRVLNDYDIDYYLAKPEVTVDRLYSVVRACLRSSQDIATILAFGKQIRNFIGALKNVSTLDDLLVFMDEGLHFLEVKHQVRTFFMYDVTEDPSKARSTAWGADMKQVQQAIAAGHARGARELEPLEGKDFGLAPNSIMITFTGTAGKKVSKGGLYIDTREDSFQISNRDEFIGDARAFVENWRAAYSTLPTGKWWKED